MRIAILNAQIGMSARSRSARVQALARAGEAPLLSLFYHRVADEHPGPWTISNSAFERHVSYCAEHFDCISLDELQRRVRQRTSYRPSVTFTFDDGYADNCDMALNLLVQEKVPCTYFVTVENVLQQKPFDHDLRTGVPLRVNTVDQLRWMVSQGIEIGLHTYSHFDFSRRWDAVTIEREIVRAKAELEQLVSQEIRYFAFPFGLVKHLRPEVIRAIAEAEMSGFCSAFGAYNLVGRDSFHIRRMHGDPEIARLRNWLSFDQRKVRREPVITYELPEIESARTDSPEVCHVV
jgi:peptidoglycan/xylan/chitin deacetylase (PgdA/CDA1 family)